MPIINPGDKILVSGANGFIATWIVRTLLEQGYAVRGTVRSPRKGCHLHGIFKDYGDKFELVVVEDITKEGAFDAAVKGVDAIVHSASPCHTNVDDPQVLIDPAVKGTIGILKSAVKNGATVRRVVLTSSAATIVEILPNPKVFSEVDWNNQAVKEVEEKGKGARPIMKYRTSKTLAERSAWDFYNTIKDEVSWDLAVIIPPYVFGPAIQEVSTVKALNTSLLQWHDYVFVDGKTEVELKQISQCWVDVRDLGEAHVRALKEKKAGGERTIVSAGPFVWQDWVNVARHLGPSIPPGHPEVVPKSNSEYMIQLNTAKAERILKMVPKGGECETLSKNAEGDIMYYRSMQETTRDILADFLRRGW